MWFLLFSMGAVLLATVGLPAARRLPLAPPPEALVACYFLVATLLRLLVRNARLSAFERKARKEARRKEDKDKKPTSPIGELGLGVGRGALQAVGGDLLGAGLSLASALLRGAASSMSAPPPPQRERRRAVRWEQLKAATCVAGVGLVCAGVAWEPLVHGRLQRAADAAVVAGMGKPAGKVQAAGMGTTGAAPRAAAPVPVQPAPGPAVEGAPVAAPTDGAGATAAAAPTTTATATPTTTTTLAPTATTTATSTSTSTATSTANPTPTATPTPAVNPTPAPTATPPSTSTATSSSAGSVPAAARR